MSDPTGQSPPVTGVPAWHTDPTGRHQLRWWDGSAFTDQVADGGTTSTDPGHASAPAPAKVPFNPALPADVRGTKASRLPIILAAGGAFVVVLALLTLLGDDDGGGGTGTFEGSFTEEEAGRHPVSIAGGTVVVVEVEPEQDIDIVVGFEVSDDDGDAIEELFEGTALEGLAQVDEDIVFFRDVGFSGDDEVTFLAVTDDVDATVVVRAFNEEEEGDYEVTIESFELDLPDDPDGDDVIEAMLDADDVPNAVSGIIEDQLALED